MWVLVEPGDAAVVPSPSYPIHLFAPAFAGAVVEHVRSGPDEDLFGNVVEAFERSRRGDRGCSCSPSRTTRRRPSSTPTSCSASSTSRASSDLLVVHDFAYADLAFDGHEPPSILQADGRRRRSRSSCTR